MFKRVMVAVVGVPFLLLVLGWAPAWATVLLVCAMCAIGAHELMHAAAGAGAKRLLPLSVTVAALAPACVYLETLDSRPYGAALAFVFLFALFALAITGYGGEKAVPFASLTAAVFAGFIFPEMLSCLVRLRLTPGPLGQVLVFLPLAISFGSDTFALFAGMLFGKHKLSPRVSPKKTVEGAIGGLVGGVVGMMVLNPIASYWVIHDPLMTWGMAVGLGLAGSVVSQVGDLSFSVIKREFGVKDYGRLLPGHGGILDRFDSVSFVAPAVWLLLQLL